MSAVPAFEIGIWNAWILIVPYILMNFGLTVLLIDRKSAFWAWPSYTRLEKMYLRTAMLLMACLWIYSIFLPLNPGTVWLYVGIPVYILGWAFLLLAMLTFISTPADKPNTTGIYRISRHPWYIGMLLIYVGAGIASASWVYLLIAFMFLATYGNAFTIPEERMCCERFGDVYREYVNRTPRWIGISKSV